jgi:hypothetical protein
MPISATQLCTNLKRKLSVEAKPRWSPLHFQLLLPPPLQGSASTPARTALASPEKGRVSISRNLEIAPQSSLGAPMEQVTKDGKSTYCAKKMVFDRSLNEQELLQETKEESCRLLMAPLDLFIGEKKEADIAQENARASCMTIQREQFEHTAHQNFNLPGINSTDEGLETTSTHSKDGANDDRVDNNGIYSGKNDDDDDGDFTCHSSDGSDEDDENGNEVLGNGADCASPTMSTCGKDGQSFIGGQLDHLPDWLHEIETNTYDASLLLSAPITQVFPCVACKNIDNPTTWITIFLRKTSNTT